MTILLDNLNKDILALIVLEVHDSSRNSVFSLLRTNRTLNEASKPFVLYNITLNFDEKSLSETNDRISRWCEDPVAQRAIRTITVVSDPWAWRPHDQNLSDFEQDYLFLTKLLTGLEGLKEFTFTCHHPMPLALIDALHEHQGATKLHIKNWTRKSPSTPFGDPVELKLAESPILRSIHASLRHGQKGMNLQHPAFIRIVTLAPNLESFHYESRHIGGCVMYGSSLEQEREEDRQAALFQVQNPERKVLKAVHLGSSLSTHLLNSPPLLDWSKLHTLTGVTIDNSFLEYPLDGSVFASLKYLSVEFGWSVTKSSSYDRFFTSLNPLERLSIVCALKHISLQMLLAQHGNSLRSFHVHEDESCEQISRRQTLTATQIGTIRDSCPQLQDLGIDVDRTKSREREASIYGLIRQMLSLTDITIHLDLGLPFLDDFWNDKHKKVLSIVYPELQPADLEVLWEAVGGKKSTKLQKLHVFVGEPDRSIGGGYPARWVLEEQRKSRRLVAERNERDDKQNVVLSGFPSLDV